VKGVQDARRVHQCRAGIGADRDAQGFDDFLLGGAVLDGGGSVDGDAAVASQTVGHGERDQFTRLGVELARSFLYSFQFSIMIGFPFGATRHVYDRFCCPGAMIEFGHGFTRM
jgi:hypothetical protein